MPHGNTIGYGDGTKFSWRTMITDNAFFSRLGLAHEGNVARCRLVPGGHYADKRFGNVFFGHAHGVVVTTVWGALWSNAHMAAREAGFVNDAHKRDI